MGKPRMYYDAGVLCRKPPLDPQLRAALIRQSIWLRGQWAGVGRIEREFTRYKAIQNEMCLWERLCKVERMLRVY